MTYFTAVFDGLTSDETVAICNNEKCRFMAHSHVGHERDHWREANRTSLAAGEVLKSELKEINQALDDPRTDLSMTAVEVIQNLKAQLVACEKYLKEGETHAERMARYHHDMHRLMGQLATALNERDLAIAALDAKIDICGDERIAKLKAMLKTNAEWWYELSDDDKGDACMEAMG
jgi:hypothetical protein